MREAGCVFAEEEAEILLGAAAGGDELEAMTARRVAGEPLEHIVGWVRFGRLRLAVGPGVFIPRQRSLLLARVAVRAAQAQEHPVVLEAFAGVAPLAATVAAAIPHAEVHVADIDPAALAFARSNLPPGATIHRLSIPSADADGLSRLPDSLPGRLTLIVAVPPYVPETEAALIPRDLRAHEPALALFGGADGLRAIRVTIDAAPAWLAPDGRLLFELNRRQAPIAAAYARPAGFAARYRTGADGQTALLDLSHWAAR